VNSALDLLKHGQLKRGFPELFTSRFGFPLQEAEKITA
jgi:hypothetical protein